MAFARIRTNFPEEVTELCEALMQAGYVVETVRPEEFRIAPADLELTVDKLPAIEAWRRLPEADTVFVAPGTPCSAQVRGTAPARAERTPPFSNWNVKAKTVERLTAISAWIMRQRRELRAWGHDLEHKGRELVHKAAELRRKWTPPREYHREFRPDATVAVNPPQSVEHKEVRIDTAIDQTRLKQEELRRQQQAEQQFLIEQARQAEESRRRAREAAEARALLEEQQRVEAMVRATESVPERAVEAKPAAPRQVARRRPRLLPRTRRERAFFRAGIAAFIVSLGLGVLAAEALHPRAAARDIPKTVATVPVPFTKPVAAPAANTAAIDLPESNSKAASAPAPSPTFAATAPVTTAVMNRPPKPSAAHRASTASDSTIADDEVVIVRKPAVARARKPATHSTIAHYSDLD